jgi:hypothetical protein
MKQQKPKGLAAHPRHQPLPDRFLGHQSHGPAGTTLRRLAADHRDDALLLAVIEHRGGARPRPLVEAGSSPRPRIGGRSRAQLWLSTAFSAAT